jgi:hypothetical protein
MFSDVSLSEKGHHKSFGPSSSLALFNPLFRKGQSQESFNLIKRGSQPSTEAGRDLLSNKVKTCLSEQVVMSHINGETNIRHVFE